MPVDYIVLSANYQHVNDKKDGYYVKGLHQPIIEQHLFDKVQETVETNFLTKKVSKAKAFRPELYLRGLIACDNCGNLLTGSASRSKTGKRHFYYHCNHCALVRLTAAEVHQRVENIIDEIKIKETSKMVFDVILKNNVTDTKLVKKSAEKIEHEIKLFEDRITSTEDMLADEQITSSTFNNIINRYKSEIAKLQAQRNTDKDNNSEHNQYLKKGIDFVRNLKSIYTTSEIQTKRTILSSIFPEKLNFSKKNSRTLRINQAILLILNTDNSFRGNKKGQLFKNVELSRNVELQGIEPWSKHIRRKPSTCLFSY